MVTLLQLLALAVGVWITDRVLLWMESRNWIYYRKSKPGGGASSYHLMELSGIFDPGLREAQEVRVKEEREEDEAGDP